jgi:hypothetical protein
VHTQPTITLGYEINIPVLAEAGILDRVAVCILDRAVGHTRDQMEDCTLDQVGECTLALEAGYTPVPEVGFILVQAVGSTQGRVAVCILVLEVDFIVVRVVACTEKPVKNHIEATYHLGLCSLITLRNTERRI